MEMYRMLNFDTSCELFELPCSLKCRKIRVMRNLYPKRLGPDQLPTGCVSSYIRVDFEERDQNLVEYAAH